MLTRIRHWWRDLGYCNGRRVGEFRTWGIRPWVGAPFFWLIVDRSGTATKVHHHVCTDGIATEEGCASCDNVRRQARITINGIAHDVVDASVMTYEALVALAGMSGTPSMTWRLNGSGGIVMPGDEVFVTAGMRVNVVHTGNA